MRHRLDSVRIPVIKSQNLKRRNLSDTLSDVYVYQIIGIFKLQFGFVEL